MIKPPELTFGLFLNCGEMLADSHADVFAYTLEQAQLAEELGYDDVWVTEHHFIPFGINSNALTLAAFLLGRTRNLRVGTAVTLSPQYHPVQLAEQAAILDQVSGGRFDFGIGRGGYRLDFEVFDTPFERWDYEVEQTARKLLEAWSGKLSFGDRASGGNPVPGFKPTPLTRPHPPLFLATSSKAGLRLAAEKALPILHYFATPFEARKKTEAAYELHRQKNKPHPPHVHTLIAVMGNDEVQIRADLKAALTRSFHDGDWPAVPQSPDRHAGPDRKPASRENLAEGVAANAVAGTPDQIVEKLTAIVRDFDARRLVFNFECIGDRLKTLNTIRTFATHVIPQVKAKVSP